MELANSLCRGNSDLISTLPDVVLLRILGLLKAKEAVRTCVLSRRWEHLWTSLTCLDFNYSKLPVLNTQNRIQTPNCEWSEDDEYEDPEEETEQLEEDDWEEEDDDDWEEEEDDDDDELVEYEESEDPHEYNARKKDSWWFVNFVNTFLLRRKPVDLNILRLSCVEHYPEQAKTWIYYAVKLNLRVLQLSKFTQLPSCIYTCTSLEELHLNDCGVIQSGTVNLPNLRKLSIHSTELITYQLLFGCPLLEELDLNDCGVVQSGTVNLPNLRKLSIHSTQLIKNQLKILLSGCPLLEFLLLEHCKFHEYEISHENLQNLTIRSCGVRNVHKTIFVSLNIPSLKSACLDFDDYPKVKDWAAPAAFLGDFLSGLVNVEILELQFRRACLKEVVMLPALRIFEKLQNFSIGVFCMCSGFGLLIWTLQSSPNLKKLTIQQDQRCYRCNAKEEASASKLTDNSLMVAISQCKSLELVEVKYWKSDQMVIWLIDAFVDGTKQLPNVKITTSLQ